MNRLLLTQLQRNESGSSYAAYIGVQGRLECGALLLLVDCPAGARTTEEVGEHQSTDPVRGANRSEHLLLAVSSPEMACARLCRSPVISGAGRPRCAGWLQLYSRSPNAS